MTTKAHITFSQIQEMAFRLRAERWIIRLKHAEEPPPFGLYPAIKDHYPFKSMVGRTGLETASYLRWMNAQGYHIYGRPDATQNILVDDLCIDALDTMHVDGINTPVVVETSEGNFQAWVPVAKEPIAIAETLECARLLARRYGGDKGAVGAMQPGRIPGTTNRKPMYEMANGQYPFARLYAPAMRFQPPACAAHILDETRAVLASAPSYSFTPAGAGVPVPGVQSGLTSGEAIALYNDAAQWLFDHFDRGEYEKPDGTINRSRLDYAVARHLALGSMPEHDCIAVIMAGSDKAAERGLAYVKQVVSKVYQSVQCDAAVNYHGLS